TDFLGKPVVSAQSASNAANGRLDSLLRERCAVRQASFLEMRPERPQHRSLLVRFGFRKPLEIDAPDFCATIEGHLENWIHEFVFLVDLRPGIYGRGKISASREERLDRAGSVVHLF